MASSGYFGTSNQYVKFWIEVITNSQNATNNTSNVTVKVWAKRTNTGYTTYGNGSVTLKVDGDYHNSGSKQIEITSSSKVYHSWTGTIKHSGDGSKKLTCSAAINIPSVLSSNEQSYSVNLKTIPRTSTFTLSKSSCALGSSFDIDISRASSGFTHSVSFKIGDVTRSLQSSSSTNISLSYSPPMSDAEYMPNSTSVNATVVVTTYNGSSKLGSSSKTIKLTCPSNLVPTFNGVNTYKVGSGLDNNVNCFVQGYSKIEAIIQSANGVYGSKITKYNFNIDGTKYSGSSNTVTSGVITNSGYVNISAEVIDSRGRSSGIQETSVRIEPYSKPFLDNVSIKRVNSDFSDNPEGIYIQVQATKNYSSLNGENTCTLTAQWQEVSGVWSNEEEVPDIGNFNFNSTRFSADKSYQIRLRLKDKIHDFYSIYDVGTGSVLLDFKKGGRGLAIGKVSEEDGFDVAFETRHRKNVTMDGQMLVNGFSTFQNNTNFENKVNINSACTTNDLVVNNGITVNTPYVNIDNHLFKGWAITSGNNYWLGLSADDDIVRMYTSDTKVVNGSTNLGSPNGRFIKLYAAQAVDISSDFRQKENIEAYNEKHEKLFSLLKPVSYTLKEGHSGRKHFGFIAQDVEKSMLEAGLEYKDVAFLQKAPLDEKGEEIRPSTIKDYNEDARIKDYNYSLAYTELISLNTHMIQKLYKEIEELKREIESLKSNNS